MASILFIDDDPTVREILDDTLARMGHRVRGAVDAADARAALQEAAVELIILDQQLPGTTGLEFLDYLRDAGIGAPVIMLTGHGSIENAVAAIKAGATDYITKPIRADQLEIAVNAALELARLRRENEALRREVMEFRHQRLFIGDSVPVRQLLHLVAMAAPTRATVLLQGESGTGKELAARAIHEQSPRRNGPFIHLNCAAIPESLVESALFGHEKGAFTGAVRRVEGAFERADGGTLLLDEVSEMRLDLQSKLLRVLQEQRFERVGGTHPISVDVRIIATTNRDLAMESQAGRFRLDLFYRLSVIPIRVPPLRERREDIPSLAFRFAALAAKETGRAFEGLTKEAMASLMAYDWPGNVRELQHTMERAVILATDPLLGLEHFDAARLGLVVGGGPLAAAGVPSRSSSDVGAVDAVDAVSGEAGSGGTAAGIYLPSLDVNDAERRLVAEALQRTGGNRTRAALLLNMSLRTLRHKLNAIEGPE